MLPTEHQKVCKCHINLVQSAKTCEASNKLKVPKYNSTLRHVRCLEIILNPKKCHTKINSKDLGTINQCAKITKKLNFSHSEAVYKNLIPINVNDSILLPEKAHSIGKKYILKTEKIPEPDLIDFLKPVQPLTNIISEPEVQVKCFQKEIDILSYYYKFIT